MKAWNTHRGGLSTLHANSAVDAIFHLEDLIREVVVTPPRRSIADAIDLIVFIEQGPFNDAGRKVTGMATVSLKNGDYECQNLFLESRKD